MKKKVIVLLGPTATGKSNLGIELAKIVGGEIISGDSVLVYQGLNIGSAKPSESEMAGIKHHMIDILSAEQNFDVLTFKQTVEELIESINAQGKIPILVGGTGLYIKAVLENYSFLAVQENTELRNELETFAEQYGNQALHQRLANLNQQMAEKLHFNDRFRVIRAIEIAAAGENKQQASSAQQIRADYQAYVYGLNMERSKLYERINLRVENMLAAGLIKEVEGLLQQGIPSDAQALQAIGYKQVVEYLNNVVDYDTCEYNIKQATRRFAKRQITWFKRMSYIKWLEITEKTQMQVLAELIAREVSGFEKV